MTSGQEKALADYWPEYGLDLADGMICPHRVFARHAPLIVEIGFGMGDTLVAMASSAPETNFIGVEVYQPGIGCLLNNAKNSGLTNLRVYSEDAVDVLKQALPDASIDKLQLFFPDPWPKRRHHKRRLINPNNINKFHRVLKKSGKILIASDHKGYIHSILLDFMYDNRFDWICDKSSDFTEKPFPSTQSKYEKKAIKNDQNPVYLTFKKISL